MKNRNTLSLTNFTLVNDTLQLKMNLNTEVYVQDDVKLRLVKNIIERMDLTELKQVYSHIGRKPAVNPITMLEIIIFCYSEGIFSSRDIEKACRNDIRIWYLLDGQNAPDHCSINRFRNKILELTPNLLKQMVDILIEEGQIDLSSIYIDETKIEAYANRYSFVWRGSTEKYQERLRLKAIEELGLSENLSPNEVLEILEIIFEKIEEECVNEKVEFVYVSGRKKPKLQRDYERIKDWVERLRKYKEQLEIMVDYRNSY